MSTRKRSAGDTGIVVRHQASCASRSGGNCGCTPAWQGNVWDKRAGKRVTKTFQTKAAAKLWRADMHSAMGRGESVAPSNITLREAADEWLAGARSGAIRTRRGTAYKPSVTRGYEGLLAVWG